MKDLLNYILPHRCSGCGRILPDKPMPLCTICYQEMPFSHEKLNRKGLSAQPLLHHKQLKGAASILNYKYGNTVQKLMHANKYYNQSQIGLFMAALAPAVLDKLEVDVVTCVPTHHRTKRKRGYNQVELFAKTIAQNLDTAFHPDLISRIKRRNSQTHRNKAQRIQSLQHSFYVTDEAKKYSSILLLDDVMTTGSTLNVCLSAIKEKSNAQVYILVMARAI